MKQATLFKTVTGTYPFSSLRTYTTMAWGPGASIDVLTCMLGANVCVSWQPSHLVVPGALPFQALSNSGEAAGLEHSELWTHGAQ